MYLALAWLALIIILLVMTRGELPFPWPGRNGRITIHPRRVYTDAEKRYQNAAMLYRFPLTPKESLPYPEVESE